MAVVLYAATIQLETHSPAAHGVLAAHTTTLTTVFASVQSVKRAEAYSALNAGLRPEWVFRIEHRADYDGQEYIQWDSQRWRVIRSYITGEAVELTVERVTDNAQ